MGKSSKGKNFEGPGDFTLPAVGKTLSAPEMSGTKALRRGTPVRVEFGVALVKMMTTPPRKKNTTRRRRERQEEKRGNALNPFFLGVSAQPHLGIGSAALKGSNIALDTCVYKTMAGSPFEVTSQCHSECVHRVDIVEAHLGSTKFSRRAVFSVKRVEVYPASHHPTLTEPRSLFAPSLCSHPVT